MLLLTLHPTQLEEFDKYTLLVLQQHDGQIMQPRTQCENGAGMQVENSPRQWFYYDDDDYYCYGSSKILEKLQQNKVTTWFKTHQTQHQNTNGRSRQKMTILDEAAFVTWLYNMYVVTQTRPHRAEIHWNACGCGNNWATDLNLCTVFDQNVRQSTVIESTLQTVDDWVSKMKFDSPH